MPHHAAASLLLTAACASSLGQTTFEPTGNPVFRDVHTADPAPLVVGDTLYVYVGHDEAEEGEWFNITEWLCYSTKDMRTWTAHGSVMKPTDFEWAVRDAWASQVIEHDGKFYFYTTVQHGEPHYGKAIGVAFSDSPTGPFVDAKGSALVRDADTPSPYGWDDIDPTAFVDDDGTAWISWGNPNCYLARLKPNMIEIDGPIHKLHLPNYTEGPWLEKRDGLYYIFYAAFAHQNMHEKICYATAENITGPWTYRGVLTENAANSYTIHPGVVRFQGRDYLFYHHGATTINGVEGTLGRRSVCVEFLHYNADGTIQPVEQTDRGIYADNTLGQPRLEVAQNIEPDPGAWPGTPLLATVTNPYQEARQAISFNTTGHPRSLAQTFTPDETIIADRIMLYAGDGFGTTPQAPVAVTLREEPSSNAAEARPHASLIGKHALQLDYTPQPRGLLAIDIPPTRLRAGVTYSLELTGTPGTAPLFWRRSPDNPYAGGVAHQAGTPTEDGQHDFALALYGAAARP
jgi:hypothetical protein